MKSKKFTTKYARKQKTNIRRSLVVEVLEIRIRR